MALKLRRRLEVVTNGMLPHRIPERPTDPLSAGAGSFKRVLGGCGCVERALIVRTESGDSQACRARRRGTESYLPSLESAPCVCERRTSSDREPATHRRLVCPPGAVRIRGFQAGKPTRSPRSYRASRFASEPPAWNHRALGK